MHSGALQQAHSRRRLESWGQACAAFRGERRMGRGRGVGLDTEETDQCAQAAASLERQPAFLSFLPSHKPVAGLPTPRWAVFPRLQTYMPAAHRHPEWGLTNVPGLSQSSQAARSLLWSHSPGAPQAGAEGE